MPSWPSWPTLLRHFFKPLESRILGEHSVPKTPLTPQAWVPSLLDRRYQIQHSQFSEHHRTKIGWIAALLCIFWRGCGVFRYFASKTLVFDSSCSPVILNAFSTNYSCHFLVLDVSTVREAVHELGVREVHKMSLCHASFLAVSQMSTNVFKP